MDLPILLECLQVFGAAALQNTMLTMAYEVCSVASIALGLVAVSRVWGLVLVLWWPQQLILMETNVHTHIQPGRGVLRLTLEEQGT